VTGALLDGAAARAGVEVLPGDALVVRGGWHLADERTGGEALPGMTVDAIRWMHEHGIAVYAGDIGDAHPPLPDEVPGALHRFGLGRLAIPLLDGCDPAELADTCVRQPVDLPVHRRGAPVHRHDPPAGEPARDLLTAREALLHRAIGCCDAGGPGGRVVIRG
jgi:kynurenine formamidase